MPITITNVRKLLANESATRDEKGLSETQSFLVTVQEPNATPLEVAEAYGTFGSVVYPAYGGVHSIKPTMRVVRKSAKRAPTTKTPARNVWLVDVGYDSVAVTFGDLPGNDKAKNIRVRVLGIEQSIPTQEAYDANNQKVQILNVVGDMYPDVQQTYQFDERIIIDFETATLNGNTIASARGKLNKDTVTLSIPQGKLTYSRTFPPFTLMLKNWDYDTVITVSEHKLDDANENQRWGQTVELLYREDTWRPSPPQKGYRWRVGGTLRPEYADQPVYLAGNGSKLTAGAAIVAMSPLQMSKSVNMAPLLAVVTA